MPIVTITMLEGRDRIKKKELIKSVTESITKTLDIPAERVRVILNEISFENYGIAGLPVKQYRSKSKILE